MNLTGEQAAAQALNAGLDVYGGWQDNLWGNGNLSAAIGAGLTSEATLDAAVRRTLTHKMSVGLFDPPASSPWASLGASDLNSSAAQRAAYDIALQGAVLLHNGADALPLRAGASLAVLGPLANDSYLYLSDYADQAIAQHHPSLLDTLRAANHAAQTTFSIGTDGVTAADAAAARAAVAAARAADQIVLALGITKVQEHEAIDRADTLLPQPQLDLAKQVLAVAAADEKPIVIVLINGGILSVDLGELLPAAPGGDEAGGASSARIALVEAFNPAGQGARALAALLFGAENRWGKLPVTIYPKDYAATTTLQNMSFVNRSYRYYTGSPLWRFGDGLSYTTFAHNCTCGAHVGEECCCEIANTDSARHGDEVLMLYHAAGDAVRTRAQRDHPVPLRALIDFARVGLEPGEATTVCFATSRERFALTDAHGARVVYPGEHQLIFSRGNGRETSTTFML